MHGHQLGRPGAEEHSPQCLWWAYTWWPICTIQLRIQMIKSENLVLANKSLFTVSQLWPRTVRGLNHSNSEWIKLRSWPCLFVQTISPAHPAAPSRCRVRLGHPTGWLFSHSAMWSTRCSWAWGHMVQEWAATSRRERAADGSSPAGDHRSSGQEKMLLRHPFEDTDKAF